MKKDTVVILDFGSQYNQLIARRVRECKVYSVLIPYNTPVWKIKSYNPRAIIMTGGPASVAIKGSPKADPRIFKLGVPILGICYGMQFTAYALGGKVGRSKKREYGYAELVLNRKEKFFSGFRSRERVWMSHGDKVQEMPKGFKILAHTKNSHIASMAHLKRKIYGVQFHPEVIHTPKGMQVFKNFLYDICGLKPDWTMASFIKNSIQDIKQKVGNDKVVLGLSGGVDSSVAGVLLNKAIGKNLHCIFVDNGLLRKYEREYVEKMFKRHFHVNLHVARAENRFLKKLKGVIDPERKRKIIGAEFIKVFEEGSKKLGNVTFLGQGTLYPDVIESVSAKGGPSATIKTHHNVGGLPKKMNLKLVEPLRDLFKDEVRLLGKELGLPDEIISRHPFPGPGLAVRIIGEVTKERADILREADLRFIDEIKKAGLYHKIWQAFAVLLPVKSVGVMGDERTYENVVALRAVTSVDGMTADWAKIPHEVLARISNRIINEVKGVNRVVYDVSSKPPATIEWE